MIKTFYKKRPVKRIFFTRGIEIRSFAYGEDVHNRFVDWRKRFLAKWNSNKSVFFTMENGTIDGNYAKIDRVGELRVCDVSKNQKTIVKKNGDLSPLWFDKWYLEVGNYGELFVNGEETDLILASEVKAWGVSTIWDNNQLSYILLVFGRNAQLKAELTVYKIDTKPGFKPVLISSVEIESTLSKKGNIYCFGEHIFLINDSQLHYYYYNTKLLRLEEVAIESDGHNVNKECCNNVTGVVVCDSNGYVYWHTESCVYFFPIGYPRKLGMIDLGDTNTIISIQTFRQTLYVYCRSRITREYTTRSYNVKQGSGGDIFNRGARYNLFYAEKNGILFYVKIPPLSRVAYAVKMNMGKETEVAEINISGVEQMFCVDGDLYMNCSYIATAQKD